MLLARLPTPQTQCIKIFWQINTFDKKYKSAIVFSIALLYFPIMKKIIQILLLTALPIFLSNCSQKDKEEHSYPSGHRLRPVPKPFVGPKSLEVGVYVGSDDFKQILEYMMAYGFNSTGAPHHFKYYFVTDSFAALELSCTSYLKNGSKTEYEEERIPVEAYISGIRDSTHHFSFLIKKGSKISVIQNKNFKDSVLVAMVEKSYANFTKSIR